MKQKIILSLSLIFLSFSLAQAQGNWLVNGSSISPNSATIPSTGTVSISGTFKWISNYSFINDNHLIALNFALPTAVNVSTGVPSLVDMNNTPVQGATFVMNKGGWTCNLAPGTVFAPGTELIFSVSNLEIKDDKAYANQQLSHFVSFKASPQNESYTDNVATTMFNTTANTPLPINLLDFTARLIEAKGNAQVELTWTTSNEVNSDYFIVQRSNNSMDWDNILRTKAQGNSNVEVTYEELDQNPLFGLAYYRLQQFDQDGNSTYSMIRTVNRKKINGEIAIYPNPSSEKINVEFFSDSESQIEIRLITVDGKMVESKIYPVSMGQNIAEMEVNHLANGFYDVTIYKNNAPISNGKFQKN